jgi:hypothetical protein
VIVRPIDDGLLLITQPDHARLARTTMEQCVLLEGHPRRGSILDAIGGHDNGWAETDAAPTLDAATARLADFVHAPLPIRHGVWPRSVAGLAADPWAAALVAHHAVTVYDRFRTDAQWHAFFARMETLRASMLTASGLPFDTLAGDYPLLRLGDLISLVLCTGSPDTVSFGPWTIRPDGACIVVTPDVFGGLGVPMSISGRVIPDVPFESDAALHEAIAAAYTLALEGEVSAAGCG